MKKRLISALLVLAMVATMVVLPVSAQEETGKDNVTAVTEQCPCGCGPVSQADWKPYNLNDPSATSMGHYYLDADYAQDGQKTVISGSDLVIDLRGHTLTTSGNSRLFLVEGYLGVLDTVGGGRIQSKTSGTAYGGVIMIRENETKGSTMELYSGTLTVDPDNKGSLAGGVIYVSGDQSTFRMHGGVVTGGRTTKHGGNIAVATANAKAEILGGIIMEGNATTSGGSIYSIGTTVLKNCKILGGIAATNGGNIYQNGGSLTMENCEIAYGTANGDCGGNIYVTSSAVFTDTGSTIRDGFTTGGASNGGGNILFGVDTNNTLTGTTVKGGVSQKYGANILNWSATTTRLIDCNIDGDVRWSGAGLSLEGKTKIGLRSNGLNLVGGSAGSVISASKLTDGAEIFVSAHWGVFTNDEANLDYFKPALRTVLSKESDGTLSGKAAAAGTEGGYCPHCMEKVTWQAYTAATDSDITESGHYYLNKSATARLNIAAGTDVVIDLNGLNITSRHRALVLKKDATLSVLDFNGAGKVTGKGGATSGNPWNGGVIYGEGACNLNIYGGTFVYSSQADKHVPKGGVIYVPASSNVSIYGGTLDGSSYNATGTGNIGGTVYLADSATSFTMSAGRVLGGNAYQCGAMSFGKNTKVEITGGVISGGTATNGSGNIRFLGVAGEKGSVKMQDCAVVGGVTTADYGGNIRIYQYDVDMDNCYIYGGVCETAYAGNISCSRAVVLTATDTIIAGGKAPRGGNIHLSTTDLNVTFTDCIILDGEAFVPTGSTSTSDGNGGNIYAGNGVVTIEGGMISGGRAARSGGNMYNSAGNADAGAGNKVVWKKGTDVPQLTGGIAGTYGGNAYLSGVTELQAVYIASGQATTSGDDLYLYKGAKTSLTVRSGAAGDIRMGVATSLLGEGVYGQPVSATVADTLNMTITLEANYGEPQILSKDGALCVGAVSVVNAEGIETWYTENTEAVAACGENEYVKLYTDNDLILTKDLTVDFNGQTVAVSGGYTLSGMDSSGDGYGLPAGKATGAANVAPITRAPNGNIYIAIEDGQTSVYHRLGMALTDIVLRPDDAGIYYQASWSCDSVVKSLIAEYGIVASLAGMPNASFRSDETCQSASFTGQIENGTKQCGVLIKDIMQTGNETDQNKKNGEMPIYATAYVTLTDGTTVASDTAEVEDDVQFSLFDFMSYLDMQIATDPTHYRKFEKAVKEFYAVWEEKGMGDWTFNRLKPPVDPTTDNEFNVLMIGSSYCYYYVEELYALLTEAGYENVNVCNVYYSGCPLPNHYNWWIGNQSNYQFYETNSTGRKQIYGAASLEQCLAHHNWDVISIQDNANSVWKNGAQARYEETYTSHSNLLPYLKSEFPQAKHLWHQTWIYELGADRNGVQITSVAQQHNAQLQVRDFALMINNNYGFERVPTGEAWQLLRDRDGYFSLCARLGSGTPLHSGDDSHDGDIGGGQLLNACVWFEVITGKDCTKLEYDPVFKYGGTVMENLIAADTIKAAAHEAVQAMKAGGCAVSLETMPEP